MKNKGITLLALIVTVIIMIILAGVSIRIITNGGIINKTRSAVDEYKKAEEKEFIELAVIEATDYTTGKIDIEKLKSLLENYTIIEEEDIIKVEGLYGDEYEFENKVIKEVAEEESEDLKLLKRYVLGEDNQGRNIDEIKDYNFNKYIDDDIIPDASTSLKIKLQASGGDDNLVIEYIIYNNELYRFCWDLVSLNTLKEYGVVHISNNDERVGKVVKYDNKEWIILYDDSKNGLQLVSKDVLEYDKDKNEGKFCLGINNSLIEDWTDIAETDLEKVIWSYNNAINSLNQACENIVKPSSKIKSVRSVGADPINKNKKSTTKYTEAFLEGYEEGKCDNAFENGDDNFYLDLERMLLTESFEENTEYFMASREVQHGEGAYLGFGIKQLNNDFRMVSHVLLIANIKTTPKPMELRTQKAYLRPVITLTEDIRKNGFESGTGTVDDPFILN